MVKEVCFKCNKTRHQADEKCENGKEHNWHYVSEQEYQYHKEELKNEIH